MYNLADILKNNDVVGQALLFSDFFVQCEDDA
jgi:hypothetical protein